MIRALNQVVVAGLLALATPAFANEYRFGVFVGNDNGQPGDAELVFAETDAAKMRDLFVEFGTIKSSDAVLLQGATARAVQSEVERTSAQIRQLVDDGHEAVFVFYYSGHGDDMGLHLGTTRIEHENLRTWLEHSGATVRIAMVDACQSGGLVRRKGGQRGPTFAFAEPQFEATHGTAIITSSAASELSQESSEIGGGFFTHSLHTALTGGADSNEDGEVSLSEAYAYVHGETASRTRGTPETQTPHWDLDLSGAGEVVVTTLEDASARINFPGDLDGSYSLWDESRRRYVAEVDGGSSMVLAVRPGNYFVHQRMPGWVEEARYTIRKGETHAVLDEDFTTVSYTSSASRGDLDRAVRQSKIPDLALRFTAGYRSFGTRNGFSGDYVSPHAIGGLEARLLSQRSTYWGFDLRTGGTTADLVFEGLAPIESRQSTSSLGGVVGFATRPQLVRAGLGGRANVTAVNRTFPTWDVDAQSRGSIGVGWNAWLGLHHGRFTGDVQLDWQMLVMKWDDNGGWPTYTDLTLALGYRF